MKTYVKTPVVYQTEAAECGAASLAMVFSFFGRYFPMEQLRAETGVSRDGCNAANLCRVAEKYGLECHGYKKGAQGLRALKPPCILYWRQNHFVVLEGFKGNRVYINDPAYGRRRLAVGEFEEGYAGIVLTFHKTERFQKMGRPVGIRHVIKSRTEEQREWMACLMGLRLCMVFPGVVIILFIQRMIDEVILMKNTSLLFPLLFGIFLMLLCYLALSFGRAYFEAKVFKRARLFSLRKLLDKLLQLPDSFFEQRYPDDLAVRIENHDTVSNFVLNGLMGNVHVLFSSVFYLMLLFLYSPLLAMEAIVVLTGTLLLLLLYRESLAEAGIRSRQETGKLAEMLGAGVRLQETLKIAGADADYMRKLRMLDKRRQRAEQKLVHLQRHVRVLVVVLQCFGIGILCLAGISQISEGILSIGMLAAALLLFVSLFRPVLKTAGQLEYAEKVKADAMREEDILAYPIEKNDKKQKRRATMEKLDGAVEVRNLSFGYNRLQPAVIADVSFSIECGERIGFVGMSGAGKTTLLKLLGGMYQPWEGAVLLDGTEAEKVSKEVRNASVSMVHAKGIFFAASIRDNITMWNPNISETALIQAAKDACIHDEIIAKNGGYEFLLTENAANISGGQKQRIAIARALATNPSVLILDDATSALDPMVEKMILDNIKRRGCTCLIAAQRLSSIRDCERIFVLEHGRIVQQGTHAELLLKDGMYCELMKN